MPLIVYDSVFLDNVKSFLSFEFRRKIKKSQVSNLKLRLCSFDLGAANFPVDEVAQAINQAIINFKATRPKNLKQIDVVIYEDKKMLASFQNVLTGSVSGNPTVPKVASFSQDGVTVNVSRGDILTSNCDVLISTTGNNFDLSGTIFFGFI